MGLNWYDYGARNYDPAIGRFTKMDRFTEKYHKLTPYSYAGNNPVLINDVQGDSLWISFGRNNQYTALYINGQLVNKDGSRYEGPGVKVRKDGSIRITDVFLKTVVSALGELSAVEGALGTNVISTLQSSKYQFTIQKGKNRFGANQPGESPNINMNDATYYYGKIMGKAFVGGGPPSDKIGTGGTIYWNPDDISEYITSKGTNANNASTLLGHELFHAYDSNFGELDGRMLISGTLRMEARAVYFENQLKGSSFFNMPLRYQYTQGSTILVPQGNPLNVLPPSIEYLKN